MQRRLEFAVQYLPAEVTSAGRRCGSRGVTYAEAGELLENALVLERKQRLERLGLLSIGLCGVRVRQLYVIPVHTACVVVAVRVCLVGTRELDILDTVSTGLTGHGRLRTFMISSSRLISS
jgi:hypothetical protein